MTPAQPIQTQQPAPAQPQDPTQQNTPEQADSNLPEEPGVEGTSLQKAYALLNERIVELFDHSGVRRSFSIPYVKNQSTADHVASIGAKLPEVGGATRNFLLTFHHAGGKGWGSEDGLTTAHPTEKLRQTLITKDNPQAIAAISAARSFLNKVAGLIGDTQSVQVAKSQLSLVAKQNGADMTLNDFGAALIALVTPPLQEVARKHHDTKSHGANHARLSGPRS